MGVGGVLLRLSNMAIRVLQLLASILMLGIFSYFLAVLADHHLPIANWIRAVEGLSGAAVLYTIFAVLLTLCLGGIMFFAFLALVLDVCFVGAMVAIAVMTRDGTGSCSGNVNTPLGNGPSDSNTVGYGDNGFGFNGSETVTYMPNLRLACRLNKAVFAVSIVGIFLFIISIFFQIALVRHTKREKRFGPSPANDYTHGTRRPFWRRNRAAAADTETPAVGYGAGGGVAPSSYNGSVNDDSVGSEKRSFFGRKKRTGGNGVVADTQPPYPTGGAGHVQQPATGYY